MSEVLEVITEFGFLILNAIEITAQYAIWNKASEKVLLKNHFRLIRHIEKGFLKNGIWISENKGRNRSCYQINKNGLSRYVRNR